MQRWFAGVILGTVIVTIVLQPLPGRAQQQEEITRKVKSKVAPA